jgi:hypothetical protein
VVRSLRLYNLGYIASLTDIMQKGTSRCRPALPWHEQRSSSIAMGLNYISPTAIKLGYLAEAQACL